MIFVLKHSSTFLDEIYGRINSIDLERLLIEWLINKINFITVLKSEYIYINKIFKIRYFYNTLKSFLCK